MSDQRPYEQTPTDMLLGILTGQMEILRNSMGGLQGHGASFRATYRSLDEMDLMVVELRHRMKPVDQEAKP